MDAIDVPTGTDLLDAYLPVYDVAITERLVVHNGTRQLFRAARDLDFLSIRSPIVTASMFVRGLPARVGGKPPAKPAEFRLSHDGAGAPGWLYFGDVPDREVAFGAVGRFWKPDIEWRDVPLTSFASFDEPGWGKIGCHFLVSPMADGRNVLTYECRTATTDELSRQSMARYWSLIRPFVGHLMRATLRTISDEAAGASPPGER